MKIVGLIERAVYIDAQLRDFVSETYSQAELKVMEKYLHIIEAYTLREMAKNHGEARLYFRVDASIGSYYVYVAAGLDSTGQQEICLYPAHDVIQTCSGIYPLSLKMACYSYTLKHAKAIQSCSVNGDIPFVHRYYGCGDDLVFLAQKDNAGGMVCTFQENVKLVHITDWNRRQFEKLLDCQYPPLSLDTTRFWLIQ